jgi:hypothetical protein
VNNEPVMQFVGFKVKGLMREYTFTVREASIEPREYTLAIANEAFVEHRVRYQDAPDVCSLKLRRELAANANHPLGTHYRVSDAELVDYKDAHAPRRAKYPYAKKAALDY